MSFDSELNKNNLIDNIHIEEKSYNALIQLLKKKNRAKF